MTARHPSRIAALGVAIVFALVSSGCFGDEDRDGPTSSTTSRPSPGAVTVGLAYDVGGRGDAAFNDGAALGLDEARRGSDIDATEATPAAEGDRSSTLQGLVAAGSDPVIGVGPAYASAIAEVAATTPDTTFVTIDAEVDGPNIRSNVFATEQGAFLVGAVAALKSQSGRIGFIGGSSGSDAGRAEAGFVAGVAHVDPDATVEVSYLASDGDAAAFDAPDRAKQVAGSMYAVGIDVIYHTAGRSGSGVFDAAVEAGPGRWAIGNDVDEYQSAKPVQQEHILTSMVKRVDAVVRDSIGEFAGAGPASGTVMRGLDGGYLGFVTSGGYVDDVKDRLDALRDEIVSGDIEVPTEP